MIDTVHRHFGEPLVIDPRMTWSRIGIQVLCREAAVLQDCSAKKKVAPKIRIHLRIREEIGDGRKDYNEKYDAAKYTPTPQGIMNHILLLRTTKFTHSMTNIIQR